MAGVRIGSSDVVVAPTPPPDIDLDAWNGSLDVLAGWRPAALCLTHFGLVEDVDAQLEATREALRREAELAAEHDVEGFVAAMTRDLAARMDEPTLASYVQAAPLDHLWLGLDRWRSRQAAVG
jgi:hypothetical protein